MYRYASWQEIILKHLQRREDEQLFSAVRVSEWQTCFKLSNKENKKVSQGQK